MKLIKVFIFFFSGLLCGNLILAQNPMDFFPHAVGDHWEYRESEYPGQLIKILTIEKDSTDSTGNIYVKYQQDPYYVIRIDTAYNVFYVDVGPFGESPGLWYKLSAQVGDRWIVKNDTFFNRITWARIIDIFQGVVFFNIPATVMQIDYWWETPQIDSFWVGTHYLAAGFGLVEHIVEPYYSIFAAGAIINGIQYGILTGIHNTPAMPDNLELLQNYPNPFNPKTMIQYDLPSAARVELTVYDLLGRQVRRLVNAQQQPAIHRAEFDASGLSSGVYIYQLKTNQGLTLTKKMILLK